MPHGIRYRTPIWSIAEKLARCIHTAAPAIELRANRKPGLLLRLSRCLWLRRAERALCALLIQPPPRTAFGFPLSLNKHPCFHYIPVCDSSVSHTSPFKKGGSRGIIISARRAQSCWRKRSDWVYAKAAWAASLARCMSVSATPSPCSAAAIA